VFSQHTHFLPECAKQRLVYLGTQRERGETDKQTKTDCQPHREAEELILQS